MILKLGIMKKIKKFNYSPLGKGKLKREKNSIQIENLSNSGLNGVAINVNGVESHQFQFKGINVDKENSVNISSFGLDTYGRLKCVGQQSFYYSPKHGGIMYAVNSKMLPKRISLIGKIKGKTVFKRDYLTPINNEEINWWPLVLGAVAVGAYVLDHACFSYENTTNYDSNGNSTESSTWKINWNGIDPGRGNEGSDDKFREYMTYDGIKFSADDIYIEYIEEHNNCVPQPKLVQIQITTNNKEFQIIE